jgi:hypothetical protein
MGIARNSSGWFTARIRSPNKLLTAENAEISAFSAVKLFKGKNNFEPRNERVQSGAQSICGIFRNMSFTENDGDFYWKFRLRSKSTADVAADFAVSSVMVPAR